MYRCSLHFYCIGCPPEVVETVKAMPPLESFIHTFSESEQPTADLISWADVILANLGTLDGPQGLEELVTSKVDTAQLILMGTEEQAAALKDSLSVATELWILPMSQWELSFRFLQWQKNCRLSRELWQTTQYLETTINSIPSLVWYKTRDGIHEKVNDSFCRTVNKTKDQVQGQGHAYIWDVERDDPACIASEEYVMRTEDTLVSEEIVQTREGAMHLTTYKSPLYDLDGTVMGTVGVGVDITRERAYEQEIVQKNQMLESLFTAMDCGVLCHSLNGQKILSTNRAALKILGYESQEEMMEDGFSLIAASVLDEDKPKLRAAIHSLRKVGDDASIEYRVRHKNGEIHHVMGNVKLAPGENWEPFYQRFLLDVTEQKQKEVRERKEWERRQAELVQALSVDYSLVCSFDLNTGKGQVLRLEEGLDREIRDKFSKDMTIDNIRRYIDAHVYNEDREMLRHALSLEFMQKELAEKSLYYTNYRAPRGGGLKYFQVKIVRTGTRGKNFGAVLGFRNVDEETRREMENKTLLENALLEANRANAAKSAFLSSMSHNIRTPLNEIVDLAGRAISNIGQGSQLEENLKEIKASGKRLLGLVNDVPGISHTESSETRLEETACSLPAFLQELKNTLQAEVQVKGLELFIDVTDLSNGEIYCDKPQLNQVLLSLMGNAIRYTAPGGTVSLRVQDEPDALEGRASYIFRIKDTGIGMNKDFVEHIFEPFAWEQDSAGPVRKIGLSMAVTKNTVNLMNGDISVRSKPGAGTEFIVRIPFRLQEQS